MNEKSKKPESIPIKDEYSENRTPEEKISDAQMDRGEKVQHDKSGLSERIRNFGYRFSETSFKRWVPLAMANRVGSVEGIIKDIRNGRYPKLLKHGKWLLTSKRGLITTAAAATLITAGAITLLVLKNRKKARLNA